VGAHTQDLKVKMLAVRRC